MLAAADLQVRLSTRSTVTYRLNEHSLLCSHSCKIQM